MKYSLELETDDYKLYVDIINEGHVQGHFNNQIVNGIYAYENELFAITFDGLNGPGSSGSFNNESLVISISKLQYADLLIGKTVSTIFKSQNFYNKPILGSLKMKQ